MSESAPVRLSGFSQQMFFPQRATATAISACQQSGVAI